MMTGRIGEARRVHRIMRYAVPARWGVARCGWAGEVTLVPEGIVSCADCVRTEMVRPEGPDGRASRAGDAA